MVLFVCLFNKWNEICMKSIYTKTIRLSKKIIAADQFIQCPYFPQVLWIGT